MKKNASWQEERKAKLNRIIQVMDRRIQNGAGVVDAAEHCSSGWNRRALKADAAKILRLSAKTLIRYYYAWKKTGKSAFDLHFRGPRRIPNQTIIDVVKFCGMPGIDSLTGALREYLRTRQECGYKAKSILRRLSLDDRRKALNRFQANKACRRAEKAFALHVKSAAAQLSL